MLKEIKTAFSLLALMLLITGLIYPLGITGIAKVIFAKNASGSLLYNKDKIIGSSLIGQQFNKAEYFHSRPSIAGNGYDAMQSSASNLSSTNAKLQADIAARFKMYSEANRGKNIPADMLTESASGLDPHISKNSAIFQVPVIAKARKIGDTDIINLVEKATEGRFLGLFGETRVNVLLLNLELDKHFPIKKK